MLCKIQQAGTASKDCEATRKDQNMKLVVTLTINSKGVSNDLCPRASSQPDSMAARLLLEPPYSGN